MIGYRFERTAQDDLHIHSRNRVHSVFRIEAAKYLELCRRPQAERAHTQLWLDIAEVSIVGVLAWGCLRTAIQGRMKSNP